MRVSLTPIYIEREREKEKKHKMQQSASNLMNKMGYKVSVGRCTPFYSKDLMEFPLNSHLFHLGMTKECLGNFVGKPHIF